jgi:hypothetical protein
VQEFNPNAYELKTMGKEMLSNNSKEELMEEEKKSLGFTDK